MGLGVNWSLRPRMTIFFVCDCIQSKITCHFDANFRKSSKLRIFVRIQIVCQWFKWLKKEQKNKILNKIKVNCAFDYKVKTQ